MDTEPVELIEPSEAFAEDYCAFAEEFYEGGEPNHQNELPLVRSDFAEFVRQLRESAQRANLPIGHVPQTHYWLVRGGRVLGSVRLRHWLTPELLREGGHIGYDIRPSERGRGYGNRILDLVLPHARALGLCRVLLTCAKDNTASARIIRHAGGRLEDEHLSENHGTVVQRYWIELTQAPHAHSQK